MRRPLLKIVVEAPACRSWRWRRRRPTTTMMMVYGRSIEWPRGFGTGDCLLCVPAHQAAFADSTDHLGRMQYYYKYKSPLRLIVFGLSRSNRLDTLHIVSLSHSAVRCVSLLVCLFVGEAAILGGRSLTADGRDYHIVTLHTGAAMLCRFISRRVCVTGEAGSRRRLSQSTSKSSGNFSTLLFLLLSPIMSFFTILFFLLCLRFTTYTYKHEHSHKSPHFPPNPFNLFTDISHFESFHLFPSSCLSVSPHLLLFINSSIRFRPRSSYPPSLFPSLSHGTLILLLLAGDVELNPGPSPLNFTHLNIRSIRSFQKSSSLHNYLADHPTEILSLNETWLQPTDSDNFVSSLAPPGYSILHSPRLTGQGGGLALIFRSFLKFKLFRSRN